MNLSTKPAKHCATVVAWGLVDGKVLLVKHKKLGIWMAPGGHIDEGELPYLAAQREFLEETGISGKVVSYLPLPEGKNSEYLPMPFAINLHEINKPRGSGFCEQHYAWFYFIVPSVTEFKRQEEEVTDIGWFSRDQIEGLETTDDIKAEAMFVFDNFPVGR
jgi:8-oxo-dGTP pyrophosphatase MutT (NUDIX family)